MFVYKKIRALLAILLLFMLAVGCGKKPDTTVPTTDSGKAAGAANPTEATNTDGTQNAAELNAGQNEPILLNAAEFEQLIRDNAWYWRALGCTFAAPEEISLEYYFYTGAGDNTQATGEELDFIVDAYKKKNPGYNGQYNYIRMPAVKPNKGLAILGLTLEDVTIPDSWAYYDKLDTYYSWRTDAYGVDLWSVTKAEKGDNGIVKVYWQTDGTQFSIKHFNTSIKEYFPDYITKMVMTLQEMPNGTYRVLSNLPEA